MLDHARVHTRSNYAKWHLPLHATATLGFQLRQLPYHRFTFTCEDLQAFPEGGYRYHRLGPSVALYVDLFSSVPRPRVFLPKRLIGACSAPAAGLSSGIPAWTITRSEEHTSELQSQSNLVCRLLL